MAFKKSKKKNSKKQVSDAGKKNRSATVLKMKKLQDKMFRDWKNSK